MVYRRYVIRGGKKFGPYFYKSVRKGNRVISVFVGTVGKSKSEIKHKKRLKK